MKYCTDCKVELNSDNTLQSRLRINKYRCNDCTHKRARVWNKHYKSTPSGQASYKLWRQRLKTLILTHYSGGTPKCKHCGETHLEFLTIDHINNDGAQHRKQLGNNSSRKLYPWLKKHNFPPGFQVLCMNCNWLKGLNNRANTETTQGGERDKKKGRKLKAEVISHYSGGTLKCACCGETKTDLLSINCTNNGGKQHRKSTGHFYYWLKRNNYPPGFQVLCMNCNCAKGWSGYCPHNKQIHSNAEE